MPGDGSGGSRSSCSRQAGTGVSTVTQMAAKPLASARATRSRVSSRSVNQYSWNHGFVTVGPTSSNRTLAPGAHDHRRAESLGRASGRQLGVGMRESVEGGRREQDRKRDRPAQDGHGGVDVADVDEPALPEPPARVRLDVAATRHARPGGAGDEVVALDRHPLPRERLELLHREDPRQLLRLEIGRPSAHLVDHVPTSFCQPASFLYLIRCGWSAAVPSSRWRNSSYSVKLPSNQRTWLSPSKASTWVAIRSRNQRSWLMTTAQPGNDSRPASSARSVSTSRSFVGSSSSRTLPPDLSSLARWTRFRSPPDSLPTGFCWSVPRKLKLET